MSEDRPYDIEVSYLDAQTKEKKTFKMRKQRWLYDQSLQMKLQDAKGQLNLKELWIARITDGVEGVTTESIRTLDTFTMNVYISKWLDYNDVNPSHFLEPSEDQSKITTS